ncbi:MAG: hypothetical protein JKX99_10850 [Robiginitomaculum sp.]|nr:hypothetical protein [Robiginitomaculum sp.]
MSKPTISEDAIFSDPLYVEILQQLRPHADADTNISPQTSITRDLGMDSLAIMDFIFDLEDAIDISIPMERIAEVQTISDLVAAVHKLQQEA